jgi:hypothetical protein
MHGDLDPLLAQDDSIVPSSGFTASVMDAIRRDAAAPPPIPFPWLRALPGLIGVLVAVVAASIGMVDIAPGTVALPLPGDLLLVVVWILGGFVATYALIVTARLIGRRHA